MRELRVLTYGGLNTADRFDSLIAAAMADREPRLVLRWDRESGEQGTVRLTCGATFEGLRGDCFIIEDTETGAFKVVDFQDSDWSPAVQLKESPFFCGALYSMYQPQRIARLFGAQAPLVAPGWFLDQLPVLTRSYRETVRALRGGPLDARLYFRGTILRHKAGDTPYQWNGQSFRQVAVVLAEKYPGEVDISDEKLPRTEWFQAAARHRLVLTLPGHPWCYREFELLNLGIPLLTYPWHTHFRAGAMPEAGRHYMATREVARTEVGFAIDPEEGADAIITAYRVAMQRPEHVERVGQAAQEWYDRMLSPAVIADGILDFVNYGGSEWRRADQPAVGALASA